MRQPAIRFVRDENGSAMLEYALISAAIGLVMLTALPAIGVPLSLMRDALLSGLEAIHTGAM